MTEDKTLLELVAKASRNSFPFYASGTNIPEGEFVALRQEDWLAILERFNDLRLISMEWRN